MLAWACAEHLSTNWGGGGRMLRAGPVLVWECQHGRRRRRRSARYPVNNACLTAEAMLPG